MVDTNLLKGKIVAAGYTQQKLAAEAGMSTNSLNAKINGRKTFDADEVYDQNDSAGFINLFGLPIKVKAQLDAKRGNK